ncbi:uncharacterized protein G6M90_00g020090 [Metarhizium brunneum]|uniref:Uncharacterized protein n=1 Tax=Metarhizium brunneum TaxID=500148 RepID=A0A7D5YNG2_9HYPO|nr:hypothetical protein G6M90_00g020090 [Metarhizium brunneum]
MTEHRITSSLWHKAWGKYKEELQAAADYQDIQKVHTLEQLMASFSSIQDSAPTSYVAVLSFNSIAPRLKLIDDFAAVLALCFGANANLAAYDSSCRMPPRPRIHSKTQYHLTASSNNPYWISIAILSAFTLEPSTFSAATPIPSFLWISADNAISIGQSFRTIANGLGLLESDEDSSRLLLKAVGHDDSFRLRLKANSNRIGNSYSNISSLLLRMGRPKEAEQSLAKCPALKDFSDETLLSTGNPRFSADMILLSRIRLAQGRLPDALSLETGIEGFGVSSKVAWQPAQNVRFSVRCSVYAIERRSHSISNVSALEQLLQDVVGISETFVEGDGQRARALYTLSKVYAVRDMLAESTACREKAVTLRSLLRPDLKDAPFEEEEFSKLCLWMLW